MTSEELDRLEAALAKMRANIPAEVEALLPGAIRLAREALAARKMSYIEGKEIVTMRGIRDLQREYAKIRTANEEHERD